MESNLIKSLETIVKTEKLNQDAFFFCGSGTKMPNEALLYACEHYLEAVKKGSVPNDIKDALISELEKAISTNPNFGKPDVTDANLQMLQKLFESKDQL